MNVFLFGKDGYDNQTVKIWLCVGLMWDAWMYVIYRNCIHNRVVSYSVLAYFPFLYLFHFFCCFFLSKVPVLTCTGMFSWTDYCYKGHPLFSFHWLKTTFVKCNMMIKKKKKEMRHKKLSRAGLKMSFLHKLSLFPNRFNSKVSRRGSLVESGNRWEHHRKQTEAGVRASNDRHEVQMWPLFLNQRWS